MPTDDPVRSCEASLAVPVLAKARRDGPLTALINDLRQEPELVRIRTIARWLGAFHLKYTVTSAVEGRRVVVNGRPVLNFGSFSYLGFEQRPEIVEATVAGLRRYGNQTGSSRMLTSHDDIVRLEREVSRLVGAEHSLICGNVSQVHEGTLPALFSGRGCAIFIDRGAHASMYEAAQIARARGAQVRRVDAEEPDSLQESLNRVAARRKVVLVDGLHSMRGHVPDLRTMQRTCDDAGAILYVDDAHGIGVLGRNGGGVREEQSLSFDNLILVGSLQKGLGCYGGFVSGDHTLIDILRVKSTSYIFSGTLQPHAVEGALAAVALSRTDEARDLRAALRRRSSALRCRLRDLGFEVPPGDSPIIPVTIGSDLQTLMAGRKLFDEGCFVHSVLYPAVPKGQGIVRVSLNAPHTDEDLDRLSQGFASVRAWLHKRNGWWGRVYMAGEIARAKFQGSRYRGL